MKGTTESGFKFEIEEDALDDIELLEGLCALDRGELDALPTVLERIIGTEQKKDLYNHVRNEKGRVPTTAVVNEIKNIFEAAKETKN